MTLRDNTLLVAALLAVEGVAGASIEATVGGPGTLRLQLAAGTDQVVVAGDVNRLLRSKFGLAVDPDRVRVVDATPLPATVLPGATPVLHSVTPVLTGTTPVELSTAGRHAVEDHATDTATDTATDHATDAAANTAANDERHDARRTDWPARAVGAYARDAVDVAPIITTDLLSANGVDHPGVPEVRLARPSRVTIDRVQLVSAGLGATVSVTLGLDGRSFEGDAEGAATQSGLLRSVATATLHAIERITEGTARFEVEHVEVARTGTAQTALVVITMLTGRSTQRLSGASVVREDTRQAVIRAVLAALNRRMESLLAEQ